jgi:hypothetical protein
MLWSPGPLAWLVRRSLTAARVNKAKYLSHLIDLDFKPKYDKCDGPEMNTIKFIHPVLTFSSFSTNICS